MEEEAKPDSEIMVPLTDRSELLYRQAGLGFYKNGRLTSQAFLPFPKDKLLVSTDRASKSTPESAFALFTAQGYVSRGTWGVTVSECFDLPLPCMWNPNPKDAHGRRVKNEAHSLIDFRGGLSAKKIRALSTQLASYANERGCLHQNQVLELGPARTDGECQVDLPLDAPHPEREAKQAQNGDPPEPEPSLAQQPPADKPRSEAVETSPSPPITAAASPSDAPPPTPPERRIPTPPPPESDQSAPPTSG
jgi:hypothetical protein